MRASFALRPVASQFEKLSDNSQGFDKFWKELVPEGTYTHPIKGFTLVVTKDRMDGWIKKFNDLSTKGVRVPVPYGHNYTPDKNAGWASSLEVRKNKESGKHELWGLIEIPRAEDSSRINTTIKDVSISINPDFRRTNDAGQIEEVGEIVEHVALTNYPVIQGMKDFVAFDQAGEAVTVLNFDDAPTAAAFGFDDPTLDASHFVKYTPAETDEDRIIPAPQLSQDTLVSLAEEMTNPKTFPQSVVEGARSKLSHGESNYRSGASDIRCGRCLFFLYKEQVRKEQSNGGLGILGASPPPGVINTTEGGESDNTPRQGEDCCWYVQDPIAEVAVCDYFQPRSSNNYYDLIPGRPSVLGLSVEREGEDMTPEQLRALEKKFGLADGSLTTENWFSTVNELPVTVSQPAAPTPSPAPQVVAPAAPAASSQAPTPASAVTATPASTVNVPTDAGAVVAATNGTSATVVPPPAPAQTPPVAFDINSIDISQHPMFKAVATRAAAAITDLNERKSAEVVNRLNGLLNSGRIVKATFDAIVGAGGTNALQFSAETDGNVWETNIKRVSAQLDILETLPENHAVHVNRVTSDGVPGSQDQQQGQQAFETQADELIKSILPQYHKDNVKMDPRTGLFVVNQLSN